MDIPRLDQGAHAIPWLDQGAHDIPWLDQGAHDIPWLIHFDLIVFELIWRCPMSTTCVNERMKCDGIKHCPNGEDELNCVVLGKFYLVRF